ncbi:hypothetical protein GLOIN_2v1811542 [Rhizophagus clarus]|uniref:Uncharacterized protein n=1 Tax=Rhizophagus clarus TaxID=94130 RepID=A0A8H3LT83_9GLOM|nr:hypothetical protein GLOIN_2v1811542 [Rhizophagus clarus]
MPNFNKWINLSFNKLNAHIKKQENHSTKYYSDNLNNLLKYYKKKVFDSKYHQLVKTYPTLETFLKEVEEHEIESWMLDCTQYMKNNLIVKYLNHAKLKLIGLYFDGASHDQNWLGHNMHNSGTCIIPIGNYDILTEHFWQLYTMYGGNSGLTTDVLNSKDKQSDELAKWFYLSHILKAISEYAEKYNDNTYYGDAIYHFFSGMLLETYNDQVAYA